MQTICKSHHPTISLINIWRGGWHQYLPSSEGEGRKRVRILRGRLSHVQLWPELYPPGNQALPQLLLGKQVGKAATNHSTKTTLSELLVELPFLKVKAKLVSCPKLYLHSTQHQQMEEAPFLSGLGAHLQGWRMPRHLESYCLLPFTLNYHFYCNVWPQVTIRKSGWRT